MMTQTVPALQLHALMLGVRDLDASVAFYTEQLGFGLRGRFEDFAFLDVGGSTLVLSGQLARARLRSGAEPVEVVLRADGVRAAQQALRARGVMFLNEPHSIDGTNDVANFEDPDGHLLSLYGAP